MVDFRSTNGREIIGEFLWQKSKCSAWIGKSTPISVGFAKR